MRSIALDYETFYSKDYSVVDLGYYKYCRDPRFDPYLISVCDGSEVWAGHPRDFNFDALSGAQLVSFNSAFDEEVTLGATEKKLFDFPAEFFGPGGTIQNWFCASNLSVYLWNVRSLADACRVGLGVPVDKGVRDRAKGKTWGDIVKEGWSEDMLRYARLDAQYCWQLWDKYSGQWPEFERRLSRLTIEQGRRGFRIDIPALEEGIAMLKRVIHTAGGNLPWVARGRAPASPIGVAEECRSVGIPLMPVKADDAEAAAEWEETYAPKFPFVLALKNLRKAKKTLATLETIQLRLRADETIAFSLKYFGASTGRWSGDSGFNVQNINKEPLFVDAQESFVIDKTLLKECNALFEKEAQGERAVGSLSNGIRFLDVRSLIVARPGKTLCPVDLSQIEPRVLNYLAGNHDLLAQVAQGMAIYEAHARTTMGWAGGDLKTEDKKLYALAKARCVDRETPILTKRGYLAIAQVAPDDLVWDGNEFVPHGGVVCAGPAVTYSFGSERYTADHEIFVDQETRSQLRELSDRASAAQHCRDASSPGWWEVWQLARLVGASATQLAKRSLREMSVRLRPNRAGHLVKLDARTFDTVPKMCAKKSRGNAGNATLGEANR